MLPGSLEDAELFFHRLVTDALRQEGQKTMTETELHRPQVSAFALFLTFSRITLSSFGGAMFWARRALVERQRWLTEQEFVELFVIGQLLPGPNVLNLTV